MALNRKKTVSKKTPAKKATPAADKKARPSFTRSGAAARQAASDEATRAEARRASYSSARRFYLKIGEDHDGEVLTFLDGTLIESGAEKGQLDFTSFREHEVKRPGSKYRDQYICLADQGERCPLCEAEDQSYFAAVFTVIDHRTISTKKGDVVDERKMLVVKSATLDTLQKFAAKAGGLVGLQFEVSRSSDQRSPKVGDTWIPLNLSEPATRDELVEAFGGDDGTGADPIDYEEALNFLDANAMRIALELEGPDDDSSTSGDLPKDEDDGSDEEVDY